MYLALDPLAKPAGMDNWRDNVSVLQAHPMFGLGRAGVEAFYLKAWSWSRKAEKAAQAIAERATDPHIKERAESIARRHNGVWRSANKLVRKDATGRQIRAVSAVRSDAGDATCPTWLEREANHRMRDMAPIFFACKKLGATMMLATCKSVTRENVHVLREALSNKFLRSEYGILGMDIIIVPSRIVATVDIHILIAKDENHIASAPSIIGPCEFKFHQVIIPDAFYFAPVTACTSMTCEEWISGQLGRYVNGERQRDRVTYGVFYGKAAEEIVTRAAAMDREHISDAAEAECRALEDKISRAINLAEHAASKGDATVANQALRFAQAYAREVPDILAGYSVLSASFRYLAQFDTHGLEDSCLPDIHKELTTELWALPLPKQVSLPEWTCIEHVTIHSPADIAALAKWVREEE